MNQRPHFRPILPVLLCWAGFAFAQQPISVDLASQDPLPHGWTTAAPAHTEDQLHCANSAEGWEVIAGPGNSLTIARQGKPSHTISFPVGDGVLIGTNKGEFGGSVEWVPSNGAEKTLVIHANPVGMVAYEGTVFVASGLSHGVVINGDFSHSDTGSLLALTRSGTGWAARTVLDLGMAPRAVVLNGPELTVLASRGVISVDLRTMAKTVLHRNDDWSMLYPHSIVVRPNHEFIVGMRSAVVRLEQKDGRQQETWWAPNGAPCFQHQR